MHKITLFHNQNCSKSCAAKNYLEEKGLQYDTVNYLDEKLEADTLKSILAKLGQPALSIIRTNEVLFKQLGLSPDDQKSNDEWIQILIDHPSLIQRPIIINKDKAVIARPFKNIHSVLD